MIRRPPRSTLFPTRRSSDLPWSSPALHALQRSRELTPATLLTSVLPTFQHQTQLTRNEESTAEGDRKSTRLNSSHLVISYAVFCLKKKKQHQHNVAQYYQIS